MISLHSTHGAHLQLPLVARLQVGSQAIYPVGLMRVLRYFANYCASRVPRRVASRVHRLWARSCLRLKHLGRYLKRQFNRSCTPLLRKVLSGTTNRAQRFFWIESLSQVIPLARSNRKPQASGGTYAPHTKLVGLKRSTGQALLSLAVAKRVWVVLLLSVVLLTACLGQRFYNQPGLDVKTIAPQTFYAPETAIFENKQETENLRNNVRDSGVQVLKIDKDLTAAADRALETAIAQGQNLREQAGSPPWINEEAISSPTQSVLFHASESEWQTIWRLAQMSNLLPNLTIDPLPSSPKPGRSLPPPQAAALRELVTYRSQSGSQGLSLLQTQVSTYRTHYRATLETLIAEATKSGQPLYDYQLFALSDEQWVIVQGNARQIFAEMMLQGIHPGTPSDLIRRAIEARVPAGPTPAVRQVTANVLTAAIQPNLVLDDVRTQLRAEQAINEIAPVMVSIQAGDLIVRAGESIDASEFALLDHFDLTSRHFNWLGLCSFSLLVAGAITLYLWVDHHQSHQLNQRDHVLVLLLCLGVPILAALRVPSTSLPAVGLLVGSFYGSVMGMTVVGLLTLILPIGTSISAIPLLSGAAAAMLGAWIAPNLRSREEFALLGGFVGLAQAASHLVLTLMASSIPAPLWKSIFVGSALHGLYGILWSIVALGISPYLEHFFDVVTPIRLAELANPNRSLLKRLAAEAPGTFQHTMFVANLAEAAARALGRNVELVRAGTLYHDIGKMHDPQGFIENQIDGPNKHDLINDPWASASLIKKHVTLGLVMARKYRLPKAVQAFIPEHQGDMKISYFYQQAKARQADEPSLIINIADFSYDGPIPQSPETGITMLADSCEAALRSLATNATIDEAYSMVDKILRSRWQSRQLVDSGLSRDDMDVIASVFIQVWQQHNHKRIAYPKAALADA